MSERDPFATIKDAVEVSWKPLQHNYDPRSEQLTTADIDRARRLIEAAFSGKTRSATGAPYVTHLYETEALLCEAGYGEDVVLRLAALFHDGPEDVPDKLNHEVIERDYSRDVARLVDGVTKERCPGQDWREGWLAFMEKLRQATDERTVLLEVADRDSNLRDALRNSFAPDKGDGRKVGPRFWDIYATSTPQNQLWMYEEMLKLFKDRANGRTNPLLKDYEANVAALRDLLEAYTFHRVL